MVIGWSRPDDGRAPDLQKASKAGCQCVIDAGAVKKLCGYICRGLPTSCTDVGEVLHGRHLRAVAMKLQIVYVCVDGVSVHLLPVYVYICV